MAILNIDNYPLFWTWDRNEDSPTDLEPKNRIHWKNAPSDRRWIQELHNRDETFFYVEMFYCDAFYFYPLSEIMPLELFEKLTRGEISLAIGNAGHGYHHNISNIYKYIIMKYNINPNNVLLRTESADMHKELEIVSNQLNLPKFRVEWTLEFEFMYMEQIHIYDLNIKSTLQHKDYSKKFLSYNGFYRPHRGALIALLLSLGILDKGIVSYNSKSENVLGSDNYQIITDGYENYPEILELLTNNKEKITSLNNVKLDDFSNINTAMPTISHTEFYENTYFSVVTESSFPIKPFNKYFNGNTDTGRILSEKIFKPILNKHPFIMVSNYHALDLLKSLGYKSFSPFIDESYDDIVDDHLRIYAIAKEVKRMCEWNVQEVSDFLDFSKEICEYNYNWLSNKKLFHYTLPRL